MRGQSEVTAVQILLAIALAIVAAGAVAALLLMFRDKIRTRRRESQRSAIPQIIHSGHEPTTAGDRPGTQWIQHTPQGLLVHWYWDGHQWRKPELAMTERVHHSSRKKKWAAIP